MPEPVIQVENLSKVYNISHKGERPDTFRDTIASFLGKQSASSNQQSKSEAFHALRDVSFEVKQGEVLGIIGRNGAGKSTLLKILSRITEPTAGRVELHGRVASLLEVGTGFHPELTGRENIFLNGAILGMSRSEIKNKFDEIIDFAGVEKFIDTPVKRFSSGMSVRLAFAVAAHLEPEILLVDEVLAVGDIGFQKKCLRKIAEITREQEKTVLLVSHQIKYIEATCSRCFLMDCGKVIHDGPTTEVISKYYQIFARHGNLRETSPDLQWNPDEAGIERVFDPDEDLVIPIRFKAGKRPLNPLHVDLAVNDEQGNEILHLISQEIGNGVNVSAEEDFCVEYRIQKPYLAPGSYELTLYAREGDRVLFWAEEVPGFRISSKGSFSRLKSNKNFRSAIVCPYDILKT